MCGGDNIKIPKQCSRKREVPGVDACHRGFYDKCTGESGIAGSHILRISDSNLPRGREYVKRLKSSGNAEVFIPSPREDDFNMLPACHFKSTRNADRYGSPGMNLLGAEAISGVRYLKDSNKIVFSLTQQYYKNFYMRYTQANRDIYLPYQEPSEEDSYERERVNAACWSLCDLFRVRETPKSVDIDETIRCSPMRQTEISGKEDKNQTIWKPTKAVNDLRMLVDISNLASDLRKSRQAENDATILPETASEPITSTNGSSPVEKSVYDYLEVGPSKIHGLGIFARAKIPDNVYLMHYEGEVIGKCMSDKRERLYLKNNIKSVYMFKVEEDLIIDATLVGNKARYINHSCNPNCYAVTDQKAKCIAYYTSRTIYPDEELSIDYHFNEELSSETCMCGADNCKSNNTAP